jgi:hypothetical protein
MDDQRMIFSLKPYIQEMIFIINITSIYFLNIIFCFWIIGTEIASEISIQFNAYTLV